VAGGRVKCSRQYHFDETLSGRKYQQVQDREKQENVYMSKVGEENGKEINCVINK
jgi:hypothetical protein